jgi:hypothetical protein
MNHHLAKAAILIAVTFASATAFAVEQAPDAVSPSPAGMSMHHQKKAGGGMEGMEGMGGMKGMMGGDMMGMMGSCHAMMNKKGMPDGAAMLQLPPGNEKLEFRMRAEMMQKMGEIALKYADQIKESP